MEKKTRKRRSTIPPEIWALLPKEPYLAGARLNKTAIKGYYQAYTATDHYDPLTGDKGEDRIYFGKIRDGKFSYTSSYLLKLKEEEIARLKARQAEEKTNPPSEAFLSSEAATSEEPAEANTAGESNTSIEESNTAVQSNNTAGESNAAVESNAAAESKVTVAVEANGEIVDPETATLKKNAEKVLEIARAIGDDRQKAKVVYEVDHVLLVALLSALGGATSCVAIADYWCNNRPFLEKTIPNFPPQDISHDTVRRLLMICNPDRLEVLFKRMVEPLIQLVAWRTVAVDGQAVRASGTPSLPRYILNFYDTENGVAIGRELVGEKTNETTVAPTMIADLDLRGAIVTCDALNTRCDFARDLMLAGADYCMAVKRNWRKLLRGMKACFENAGEEEIRTVTDTCTAHGRVETRTIQVLPARNLSRKLLERWFGLSEGCIIKTTTETVDKKTGRKSSLDRYFVTSLRFENPNIVSQCATSIRRHYDGLDVMPTTPCQLPSNRATIGAVVGT